MIAILSSGIIKIPSLELFLEEEVAYVHAFNRHRGTVFSAVAGWGNRPTAEKARRFAKARGIARYLSLEDGFLRSVGLGNTCPPLSIVVDDLGIYYDATRASRLEQLIASESANVDAGRIAHLRRLWCENKVSKYNHQRDYQGTLPDRYVLVADQTAGDVSIRYGLASPESFHRMLDAALAENPDCMIVLKVHPEVMAGRKQGHFDLHAVARHPRVRILAEDAHPATLIERAEAVYTVTSQIGFEGLLWDKRVRTFGMPFYAGWGLTHDELPAPARRTAVTLERLIHAALIAYPRYIDPETRERCAPERVIEWLGLQRRQRARYPAQVHALRFSGWKQPIVRRFFSGSTVRFVKKLADVPADATLIVWGKKDALDGLPPSVSVLRLEDGFIRSVGLGAGLVQPLSWVIDDTGIYYDATRPSALEKLLQTTEFSPALVTRAAALREAICTAGVTKYNVGGETWQRPQNAGKVILVPGQVETDASIAYGAPHLRRNVELLKAVREANPDAYVLYKPHPDVLAALRKQGVGESQAHLWCNEVIGNVPFHRLLEEVDEVHVLTSLAGFEALMRGKPVVCYGQPFYSGWGLTRDIVPHPRRTRMLSLDQLVAAALILYPTYVSRQTGKFTTPERALQELQVWRTEPVSLRTRLLLLIARLTRKD